jgi:CheY-like chemotaxis protein
MVQSHNSGATKKTVLVVDDSTTMRSMVQSFLPQDEYHVQVAKSGQEGLARIQEHCPDILLLDFIMPGMNGYEVYISLREQPEYIDLPIVIMSGSKVEVFNKFAESKAEQKFIFLSKPFDPETLKKQISLALELRLIPTAIEDIPSRKEVYLEQPVLRHEPVLAEEAPAVVREEIAVSPEEILLPDEAMVSEAITVLSEVALQEEIVLHPSPEPAAIPIDESSMETILEQPHCEQPQETVLETEILDETLYSAPIHPLDHIPEVQILTEETSIHSLPEAVSTDAEVALIAMDNVEPSLPCYEPAEIPMAQIPLEDSNFDYFYEQELTFAAKTIHSLDQESAEIPMIQIPIEVHSEVYSAEPIHEEPAEKILVAQTSEETAEISKPQVSAEDMGLSRIHQNLAHILETETYVMSALQSLDERTAEDIRSIRSLADDTNRLQQEFMYVRSVLDDLTELPKQLETLKEQVLSQPQPDKTGQEHLTIVGDRFNSVDAVLLQSVVTLDRLEEIQTGLGETINTSYGQLSDRLTVIERRFEAIIVRPPDPISVVSSPSKRQMPPLLYITIALGALNLGAIVALLVR